ncbi:MAG: fibronectin type III domain-containing protein [Acidimicrobiales bacterium]
MKNWVEGLRQWSMWLVGDSPMPGRRSRVMLAGTFLAVALLVTGLIMAFREPIRPLRASAQDATTETTDTNPTHAVNHTSLPAAGPAGDPETTVPPIQAKAGRSRAPRGQKDTRTRSDPGVTESGATTTTTLPLNQRNGTSPAAPPAAPARSPGSSPASPPLVADPAASSPSLNVPSAPLATKAASGHGWSRVTWTVPFSDGGSTVAGYDLYMGTSPGAEGATPVNSSLITTRSYLVPDLSVGTTYYFKVVALNAKGASAASNEVSATPIEAYQSVGSLTGQVIGMASNPQGTGYWVANSLGAVSAQGAVGTYGSTASLPLNAPVDGIVATPDGKGYWEVAGDGGVFAFGDAGFYGSMGGAPLNAPVVALAATPDGKGYWEVASDGGIFSFGDAGFYGSMGGARLNSPVVGMAATPDGNGYWAVASDGGVFAFGDAGYYGSMGGAGLNSPVVGMGVAPDGGGYWEVASDGGVFTFGSAVFHGSGGTMRMAAPVAGMTVDQATGGYWIVAWDGGIFAYGAPFLGVA